MVCLRGENPTTHIYQMKLFNSLIGAGIITLTVSIASPHALASNIKEGYANGVNIHYLQDADGMGVDFIAVPNAPAGDHRLIVNCRRGKIMGSKGSNSKEWERATAISYCDSYR